MASEAGYFVAKKGKVPSVHCTTFKEARKVAKQMAPAVILEPGGPGILGGYSLEVVEST